MEEIKIPKLGTQEFTDMLKGFYKLYLQLDTFDKTMHILINSMKEAGINIDASSTKLTESQEDVNKENNTYHICSICQEHKCNPKICGCRCHLSTDSALQKIKNANEGDTILWNERDGVVKNLTKKEVNSPDVGQGREKVSAEPSSPTNIHTEIKKKVDKDYKCDEEYKEGKYAFQESEESE